MKRLMWPLLAVLLICANVSAQFISVPYRPRVDVTKYGAKKDSTSGAATIQAFHRALAVARDTGVVYVPAGRYLLDSTFTININNANVECDPGAYLYFPIEAQNSYCRNGVVFDSVSGVQWNGGNIIGNADSSALVANVQPRANAMLLWSATRCRVSNVKIRGFEYGIKLLGKSTGTVQSTENIVEYCEVRYCQRDNIILTNASRNTIRYNVTYESGYVDYGVDDTALGTWDINDGDVGSGIAIRNFDFSGSEDTSWYNWITGNEVYNCRGQGIILWRQDSTTEDVRYTTIGYNVIHDVRYHGIQVANAPFTVVQGNDISNTNRPNNWLGNIYAVGTFNNGAINVELHSDYTKIIGNICHETKVFDTANPDEAMMFSGVNIGDGAPKTDSLTESTVEPAPNYVTVYGNSFANTKRYQKLIIDSTVNGFTHREVDGYVVNGIAGTDTLWRTDVPRYNDGRDNMSIDTFSLKTAHIGSNDWGGVAPLAMLGPYPIDPSLAATGGTVEWSVKSIFDRSLVAGTDAGASSGIDAATANGLIHDTADILRAEMVDTAQAYGGDPSAEISDTADILRALLLDTTEVVGIARTIASDTADAVRGEIRDTGDVYYVNEAGDTMGGELGMNGHNITTAGGIWAAGDLGLYCPLTSGNITIEPGSSTGTLTLFGKGAAWWVVGGGTAGNRITGATNSWISSDTGVFGGVTITADADIASESEVSDTADALRGEMPDSAQVYIADTADILRAEMVDTAQAYAGGGAADSDFVSMKTDTVLPHSGGKITLGEADDTVSIGAANLIFAGDTLDLGLRVLTDWMFADTMFAGGIQFPLSGDTAGNNGKVLALDAATKKYVLTTNASGLSAANVSDSIDNARADAADSAAFYAGDTATVLRGEMGDTADIVRAEIGDTADVLRAEMNDTADAVRSEIRDSVTVVGNATYETITNVAKIGDDTANFKTAYGWGDHSAQNYLDNDDPNVDTAAWNAAAGGGITKADAADTAEIVVDSIALARQFPFKSGDSTISFKFTNDTGLQVTVAGPRTTITPGQNSSIQIGTGTLDTTILASSVVVAPNLVVDSTYPGNDALAESNINWHYEVVPLMQVRQNPSPTASGADTVFLKFPVMKADTSFLVVDSSVTASQTDWFDLVAVVPEAMDADSFIFAYQTNGAIDSLNFWVTDKSTNIPGVDSLHTGTDVNYTSTSNARIAIAFDHQFRAGDIIRVHYRCTLTDAADVVKVLAAMIKGKRN